MNEDWVEIEGKNKEDALERACNALNTNRTHMKYEVVEEGSKTKIRARKVEERQSMDEEGVEKQTSAETATKEEEDFDDAPIDPELGSKAKTALEEFLKFIDAEARVELKEVDEKVVLEIFAENAAVLIGKHGQTLGAIQYLVTKMLKLDRKNAQRLVIDSEQYRARRQESLEDLAHRLAYRAKRTGRPVSAEPMNALDRRTIHMALSDSADVTTKSVGEGLSRKVLIVPNEQRRPRGRNGYGARRGNMGRSGNRNGGSGRRPANSAPRRMHDSFDTPPEPEGDFFDEEIPDAPMMDREEE